MSPGRRAIAPRRPPRQQRSARRVSDILAQTARLLEQEGPNRLTTNLVAKRLGMSVGTLYHYFPNKHAILHVLGAAFLDAWQRAFDEVDRLTVPGTSVAAFVALTVNHMEPVYRAQPALHHLVQAMFTLPELRALDERQDEQAVARLSQVLRRLGVPGDAAERGRRARLYLKISNTLLLEALRQRPAAARRTLRDLEQLLARLLQPEPVSSPGTPRARRR